MSILCQKGWIWSFYFGNVPFLLFCMLLNCLSLSLSCPLDRGEWLRCPLWHGWLPGLGGAGDRDPWAASFGQLACCKLEYRLGAYPGILLLFGPFLNTGTLLTSHWKCHILLTFGLMVVGRIFLLSVAGAGVYLPAPELAFESAVWGVAEEYGDARLERSRAFMPVPGPLQTVQRAEFWGAIIALQSYWPCHLGIVNLNVARSVGRLLDKDCLVKPPPLVKDGDLGCHCPVHDPYPRSAYGQGHQGHGSCHRC